jgi:hypothetical protein
MEDIHWADEATIYRDEGVSAGDGPPLDLRQGRPTM